MLSRDFARQVAGLTGTKVVGTRDHLFRRSSTEGCSPEASSLAAQRDDKCVCLLLRLQPAQCRSHNFKSDRSIEEAAAQQSVQSDDDENCDEMNQEIGRRGIVRMKGHQKRGCSCGCGESA